MFAFVPLDARVLRFLEFWNSRSERCHDSGDILFKTARYIRYYADFHLFARALPLVRPTNVNII